MPTVRFIRTTEGRDEEWVTEVAEGENLLEASRRVDAPVQTLCNGIASCIQCRVRIVEGDEHLSPPESLEKDRIGNIFHLTRERMGCQAKVYGDVVVEVLPVRLPRRSRRSKRRR